MRCLQGVQRHQTGNYTCIVSNLEGDAESNEVLLKILCEFPVCNSPTRPHSPRNPHHYKVFGKKSFSISNRKTSKQPHHPLSLADSLLIIFVFVPLLFNRGLVIQFNGDQHQIEHKAHINCTKNHTIPSRPRPARPHQRPRISIFMGVIILKYVFQ